MNPQLWWYVARATGVVAWGLASLSVLWGLALSGRPFGRRPTGPWLLDLHRFFGGLAVVFVAVHIGAIVADTFVHFGWADVLVPFASNWKPLPVALGVVALYCLVAVELTSLAMNRLPKRFWRGVHFTSAIVFVASTVHFLTAGTDRSNTALRLAIAVTVAAATFLLTFRIMDATQPKPERRARVPRVPVGVTDDR